MIPRLRWLLVFVGGLALAAATGAQTQQGAEAPRSARMVLVADLEGVIGPPAAHHVRNAVDEAETRNAEALVLRMNTPGGLATSMREIIAEILGSTVPVIGFVAPSGGHAASAGTYILYATHVAAMAPGTNLGAATPVQIGGLPLPSPDRPESEDKPAGGEDGEATPPKPLAPEDPMTAKMVNDAVAYIRSLAELRGRNADWAESAVREAASLSAAAALEQGVIDVMAADVDRLLAAVDGRTVEISGATRALETAGARTERLEPTLTTRLLALLANPNVAFLLMMIGAYGLIFEIANPGIGPGVPGAICLILGLYALNQLPLDYTGLALLGLGVVFMIAEAVTPSFGVFGLGGIAAFTIGAAMLIDTDVPEYQLSWATIATTAAISGALLVFLLGYIWRAQRRRVSTGALGMVGARASVRDWSGGAGHVWVQGERWEAVGDGPFAPGDAAEIVEMEGLTLKIRPVAPAQGEEPPHQQGAQE